MYGKWIPADRVRQLFEDWDQVVHGTGRCDRAAGTAAVRAAHAAAGLPEPAVLWVDSPLAGLITTALLRRHPRLSDSVLAAPLRAAGADPGRLPAGFADDVHDLVLRPADPDDDESARWQRSWWSYERWAIDHALVADEANRRMWDPLGPTRFEVHRAVMGRVFGRSRPAGDDERWKRARSRWHIADSWWKFGAVGDAFSSLVGQGRGHVGAAADGPGLVSALMRAESGGGTVPPRLAVLAQALREVGWWWPMRGVAVLADRPAVRHRDVAGRLHSAEGPALAWADGFAVHAWHGVRVPADLTTGDGWDVDRITDERDAEVRHCAIERMGWERFIEGARLVPVGPQPAGADGPGVQLRLYDLPHALQRLYSTHVRMLVVTGPVDEDGRRDVAGRPVRADIDDPVTAAAGFVLTAPGSARPGAGELSRPPDHRSTDHAR